MLTYKQKTGELFDADNKLIGKGYAGAGVGKNNPNMEDVKNVGPLPKGIYHIGEPYDSLHTGQFTLSLIPDPSNKMYGRSDFKIHGDNGLGTASEGCICIDRISRIRANGELDKTLKVI